MFPGILILSVRSKPFAVRMFAGGLTWQLFRLLSQFTGLQGPEPVPQTGPQLGPTLKVPIVANLPKAVGDIRGLGYFCVAEKTKCFVLLGGGNHNGSGISPV